jgi:hypothetical protein
LITVYVHLDGLETALMELDDFPGTSDTMIIGRNCRRRDGKDLPYVMQEVTTVVFPLSAVKFIEVMPSGEEDEIETFIRE